ncbi:hypothetical protein FIBSPDRAFT_858535 [Athelia psychrophila]|uniref:Secreted protein n=1 Tax=Athelia psychrophila TaxID=1759441 RepID=A0A166LSS9_9AGAM|nr:hypothetical protein FIBSPDRAFT_858535 [Fibularhizoctonia sp. CBS 109695]
MSRIFPLFLTMPMTSTLLFGFRPSRNVSCWTHMRSQGRGIPASALGVEFGIRVTSEKGVTSEEEGESGVAKVYRAMAISPRAISAWIPSSARDSFSLRAHAFRYVSRLHENPSHASSPPPPNLH